MSGPTTAPRPITADIAEVRDRHRKAGRPRQTKGYCAADMQAWPCDAVRMADAADHLNTELAGMLGRAAPTPEAAGLREAVKKFLRRWDDPERYHPIPAVDDLRAALAAPETAGLRDVDLFAVDRLLAVGHRDDDRGCSCDECMAYGAEDEGADWYRIPPANRIAMRILDGGDDRLALLAAAFRDHDAALTPSQADRGLDAAWAEAEAALPEGWERLRLERHRPMTGIFTASVHDGTQGAMAIRTGVAVGAGPTPAAALKALAARLSTDPAERGKDAKD